MEHFPKPGVLFPDITTLLLQPKIFQEAVDAIASRYKDQGITHIVSMEARGWIIGAPVALALKLPFVCVRKPRKLPGETISASYSSGYVREQLEMHIDAIPPGSRIVIVDDLVASGSTLEACSRLVESAGAEVVECACVVEINDMTGRSRVSRQVFTLLRHKAMVL